MPNRLVIADGVRTPFCRMGTSLEGRTADDLGRIAVDALLTRTGFDPGLVDEVIFGCVAQPADAANLARVIALRAGLPPGTPAVTVQRNCASGLEALTQAEEKAAAGRGEIFIVGGTESMTRIPLFYSETAARRFRKLARAKSWAARLEAALHFRLRDFRPRVGLELGLTDPVSGYTMGETAEVLAREWRITREDQDAFALESHRRAVAARETLREEICPVYAATRLSQGPVVDDNGPRDDASPEGLAGLKPAFDRQCGSVTPGNASQITDGAAALLVMTEKRAEQLGIEPLGFLAGAAYAGCDPKRMGLGPLHALARLRQRTGREPADADLVEINEAFAAQVLAVLKAMDSKSFARDNLGEDRPLGAPSREIINVNGGAIALGHPVGASGTRLVLTALRELRRRKARNALVTLCIGGGQGAAAWLEGNG